MNSINENYISIGKRIRARRLKLTMTQEELAERANVTCSFIGHLERGEKKPSLEVFVRLCITLNLSADFLLFGKKYLCDKTRCKLAEDILSVINGKWDEWAE